MPKAYSLDLRGKILEACLQKEGSHAELAKRFKVSLSTIKRIKRRYQETGEVVLYIHHAGRKTVLASQGYEKLKGLVEACPDRTLEELSRLYEAQEGKRLSLSTLYRILKRLNLGHKKKSHYAKERDDEEVKKKS